MMYGKLFMMLVILLDIQLLKELSAIMSAKEVENDDEEEEDEDIYIKKGDKT